MRAAVAEDRLGELFEGRWTGQPTGWSKWRRTQDLRTAGFRAFHVHVGATASVRRSLYVDAGGMDSSLKLGEDIELGYRLAMKGAVFVAEREATSWHLGRSHLMRHQEQVQRYNAPHIAQRVPDFRKFRQPTGRSYRVPYVEAVVDVTKQGYEQVKHTVDGLLRSGPGDLRCLLVGPWSGLDDDRRDVLGEAHLDLRLVQEDYSDEQRVGFVEKVEQTAFPAQFRLHVPVGWRPADGAVEQACREMQKRSHGLRSMLLPDGRVARLERTAAYERAARVRRPGEVLDDVVDDVAGTGGPTAAPTASSRTTRSSRRPRRPRSLHRAPAHRSPPASATPAGRGPHARCGSGRLRLPHPSSLTPARPAFPTPLRGPVRLPFLLTVAAAALLLVAGCSPATEDDRDDAERTERTERVALQVLPGIAQPGTGTAGSPELSLLGPGRARATRCAAAAAAGDAGRVAVRRPGAAGPDRCGDVSRARLAGGPGALPGDCSGSVR